MTTRQAVSVLVASSLISMAGCSNIIAVHSPATMAEAQEMTRILANRMAKVEFVGYDAPHAQPTMRKGELSILDDHSFVLRMPSETPSRIAFENTRSIRIVDHARGAVDGLLTGAISGGLVGLLVGYSVASGFGCKNDISNPPPCHPYDGLWEATVLGALVSGAVGTAIGAAIGHRTTFTF
jgi:uncharacterized protein YcfJ